MDEDAKYHLSQVIADVHRRLDREKSANHGLAEENDDFDRIIQDLNDENKDLQRRVNELNEAIGNIGQCAF